MIVEKGYHYIKNNYFFSRTFKNFLKCNRKYWSSFDGMRQDGKYILVDLMVNNHPGYLMGNCIIANYLKKMCNADLVGIVTKKMHRKVVHLAKSYHIDKFLCPYDLLNRIKYEYRCLKRFRENRINNLQELLNLHSGSIKIGDLIYDTYLKRTGCGTIEDMTALKRYIKEAIYLCLFFKNIFERYDITATVQGHIVYSSFGILARTAIAHDAKVYARKPASGSMTIKRCTSMDDTMTFEYRVDKNESMELYRQFGSEAVQRGKAYIEQRFFNNSDVTDTDAITAYSKNKKLYTKQELLTRLNISAGKPIVCIMSHIFPDAPHSHKWMLYNDYYEWLYETIKLINNINNVNWIIKEHPSVKYYNPRHTATEAVEQLCINSDHIKLVPENLNSASLLEIVDAIVTVRGTAGLEFSTFGIPCIVTGESPYSNHGFTIEPQSKEEYTEILNGIHRMCMLKDHQARYANFIAFLIFCLFRVKCSLIPDMQAVFWEKINEENVWREALHRLKTQSIEDDPLYNALNVQIENETVHTHNLECYKTIVKNG
jgi:hypothetical protein